MILSSTDTQAISTTINGIYAQVATAFNALPAPTPSQTSTYATISGMVTRIQELGSLVRSGGWVAYLDAYNTAILTFISAILAYPASLPFAFSPLSIN